MEKFKNDLFISKKKHSLKYDYAELFFFKSIFYNILIMLNDLLQSEI